MRHKSGSNQKTLNGHLRLFVAIRSKFKEGYSPAEFRSDLLSGLVVALIAIPLGMALAIASGVAPQYGLYTVIVGGGIVALFGGSRFQVTGPTAAFVVILLPVVQEFGFGGLLVAGVLAGLILVVMGLCRMGQLIQFIPYPVTTGFTSGIAVVIATLQLKDFFGLPIFEMPESFFGKVGEIFSSFGAISVPELSVGLLTLSILVFWPKVNGKIPAPLVALLFASLGVLLFAQFFPNFSVETIGSRFSFDIRGVKGQGIPQMLPSFDWPWNFTGPDGRSFAFSIETIEAIIPSAFAIAMLGAIESLLSAVVADGMTRTKHDPDAELVALGIGNIICPFFGGIPATGAIARTATNIRFGAKSPISAIAHSIFTVLILLMFAPFVSYLPMAALAALLLLVAYNMSEYRQFFHILKVAPRSDVAVLLICFSLTVIFDMVVGVTVGVLLAALLFMRRMAEVTEGHKVTTGTHPFVVQGEIPHDIVVYEIEGPLFFGAAEKAAETLVEITDNIRGVIFLLKDVPTMDITGLVALEGAIKKLRNKERTICLVGLKEQPLELISKSTFAKKENDVLICKSVDDALSKISNHTQTA